MNTRATSLLLSVVFLLSASMAISQDVEKPPEVIPLDQLPAETSEVTALRKAIESELDTYRARMIEMNDWMYDNPETGHKEVEASKMLASELDKNGFEVAFGVDGLDEDFDAEIEARYDAKGMPTAFVAKYKGMSEHPVIGFVFEVDALRADRGPFHGCQHNQQGASMVGAAIALSKVLEKNNLQGSVWAIHTPAEEIPPPTKVGHGRGGALRRCGLRHPQPRDGPTRETGQRRAG